jgi:hypothetical protein
VAPPCSCQSRLTNSTEPPRSPSLEIPGEVEGRQKTAAAAAKIFAASFFFEMDAAAAPLGVPLNGISVFSSSQFRNSPDCARPWTFVDYSSSSLCRSHYSPANTKGLAYSYSNQVDSAASLANLGLSLAGISISADSVVAMASQVLGGAGAGSSYIDNLVINGVTVPVTGAPNQIISIPGGQVVLNEQTISSTGSAVVNAIHITVNGVADVVVASATAAVS